MRDSDIWRVVSYYSGTITAQNLGPGSAREPHIGIYYRASSHELGQSTDIDRFHLAERICRILNEHDTSDPEFVRETEVTGNWRGIRFSAIGPMIDKRPPTCWWIEDDSVQANVARIHLMDEVCGKKWAQS